MEPPTGWSTPTGPFAYSVFDVMDDVSHALEIEVTKRRIERSNSLEELRHLSLRCIDLMKHQRQALQQVIEQAIDEGLM